MIWKLIQEIILCNVALSTHRWKVFEFSDKPKNFTRTSVHEFIYTVDYTIIIVKSMVCLYSKSRSTMDTKIQDQLDSHGIGKNLIIIHMSMSHYPHCFDLAVRICKYEWLNVVAFNTVLYSQNLKLHLVLCVYCMGYWSCFIVRISFICPTSMELWSFGFGLWAFRLQQAFPFLIRELKECYHVLYFHGNVLSVLQPDQGKSCVITDGHRLLYNDVYFPSDSALVCS